MEKFNMIVTGGNLFLVVAAGVSGMIAWLGTLTWKLSSSLTSLSKQGEQTQAALAEFRSEARSDIASLRSEVRADISEVRKELTQINTRLSRVEGHVGLVPAEAGPK